MAKIPYLYKRGQVWYCDFVFRGVRYRNPLGTNKALAIEKVIQWKKDLHNTKYAPTEFNSFVNRYFDWASTNKNIKTIARDKLAFKYLKEFKTIKDLKDLSPLVLDEFKSWLIKQGKKNHNVNRLIQSIKTAIHRAEDWELIEKRSYSIVKKMKVPKGRILFYTPEEVKKLLQFVPDNWKVVVLLGSRAGLRRGEIANLQWKDIDFDKNILTIQSKENWHPKTYECRDIPIDTMLLKELKNIYSGDKDDYVAKTEQNKVFTLMGISAGFRKIIKRSEIKKGSLHTLRHTFASHLVQNGVDLYTVSKLLGHSSIKTTEIYAHLSPNTFAKALTKLPKLS